MPRRGEESSPAPRRSPRAAVKASASPSPIIRVSRSQSSSTTAKQPTPKTRAASPSPKGKAAAKGAKSKVKEETPKASQRSPRTPASKQSGDSKKTPASGGRTIGRQSSAKSAAKGKSRQSKEAEEEEESSSEEETTTPATKGRSRSKSQSEVKETPARGKAGRGQAAAAEKKGQSAATRKGKSPSVKETVTKEEEASAEEDQDKGKTPNKKQASADSEARPESRSRRSVGRKSEDAVTEEVAKGRTARSRSRGQGKKAAEEEEEVDSVVEEPKGRAARARSRGQSKEVSGEDASKSGEEEKETGKKESSDVVEESESKAVSDVDRVSDAKSGTKESSEDSGLKGTTKESEQSISSDSKCRKRGAVEIEKSPESISPALKKKRVGKGATETSPEKESTKVAPEEIAGATVEVSKSSTVDQKPKLAESEKKAEEKKQIPAAVTSFTESKTTERIETDMEVDVVESPTKISQTPSPKKTPTKQPLSAVCSPKKAEPAAVQATVTSTPTVMATAKMTTPSTGVIDLSKSPVKHQTEVHISKAPPAVAGLHSPVSAEHQQQRESPSKIAAKSPVNLTKPSEPVKTVSKSESIVIESAPKSSPILASVPKTEDLPVQSSLTKSNSETVSAKISKDVPDSSPLLKSSPSKSESVVTCSKPPNTGEMKPHPLPSDKAVSDKTAKPSITQPLSMVSAKTPVIQAPSAKTTIAMERTPPPQTTTNVTSPSSKPSAVPSVGSFPAKSPVKPELKSHTPSIMAYSPSKHFTEASQVGSPVRSHVTMHGSPVKLASPVTSTFSPAKLPDHSTIPQRPSEGSSLAVSPSKTGVDLSSKQPGHSSPVTPKIMSYTSSQSLPAKPSGPASLSTLSTKTSNVESLSGKPSPTPVSSVRPTEPLPMVSNIKTPPQSTPPKDKQPVTSGMPSEKAMSTGNVSGVSSGTRDIDPSHTHDLSLKPPHASCTSYPISTPHTGFSKSVSSAHAPPTTAALPQRIPSCKPTPDFSVGKPPVVTASPTKVTLKPNSPASEVKHSMTSPSLYSKTSSQQSDTHCSKPLPATQMSLKSVPQAAEISTAPSLVTTHVDTKVVSSTAAEHKQSKPYYLDKPHVTASSMKPILPSDAAPSNPVYYSSSSKPPMSTSDMSASKSFSPTFPSNPMLMSAMPKTPSSPADSAAMSRHMGTMPPKPATQEAHHPSAGFAKLPGSPPGSIAASKPPMAHSAKPQITHMTGVVTSKAVVAHGTSISSGKPQITHMTGTVPPKVSSPSPALSKPPVTHMAGIALQKPQVTHMAGVAPPKPQIQSSESGLSSKPVVLHAMGSASKPISSHPSGQSPSVPPSPNKMETLSHGSNTSADTDRTKSLHEKSQPVPVFGMDPSKYMSSSKSSDPGCGRLPVDMTQKPYGGHYMPKSDGSNPYMPRPQGSPVSYAKGFNLEQKCEQLQHPQKSVVQTVRASEPQEVNLSANKPKPLLSPPGNTDQFRKETIDLKASAANSQDSFKVKSMVPDATVVGSKPLSGPHDKVPSLAVTSNPKTGVPVTGCGALNVTTSSHDSKMMSSKPQHNTGSSVNTPQLNKPAYSAAGHPVSTFAPVSTPLLVTSSGSSKAESVDGINGTKTSTESQQVCDLSKKRKADSSEEDAHGSKKARSAEEEADLVANGQKTSRSSQQASRIAGESKVNKTETTEVSQSSTQSSSNVDALLTDYVVVNKDDVPPKDSVEVRQSLPKSQPSNPKPSLKHPLPTSQSAAPPQLPKLSASSGLSCSPSGSSPNRDTLLSRTFRFNPALPSNTIMDKSRQFSVVSYNILADCHFHKVIKDRYPAEEKLFLELPARHKRLMAELSYIDADVVCLQEVEPEYYSKTLSPDMQKLGYEGFYKKRVHENYDEGETTFYKTSRFSDPENTAYSLKQLIDKDIQEMSLSEEVKESVRRFMCLPDVLLVTRLRCKNTGKFITVGNVHINWGNFKLPNIQCVQIARAIREVVNRAGSDSNPHVICGDFNSSPKSPGYQLASEGYLADAMIQLLQSSKTMEMPDGSKSALVDHLWEGFQHTSSSLKSAYAVVQSNEPALTTMTLHTRECLDYVFYSSTSLEAVGVLQVPSKQNVLDCKFIPNRIFPSDHLSLKAVLAFK
ncbi:mucin-17 [Octopus bimaculoides]|uniref:Endonuclease/exonuclease/phosphatase domain-containing protein n=1 Tax=Octopus bimaculoides TaxID=37653 RepID=A0A0L8GH44_OCTBM|nr:mucin-17 [Octopus bimaculoides]|eukprot:XP_014781402.1 PREDICTED: mucin-17-like [Octopus bimaculoides]